MVNSNIQLMTVPKLKQYIRGKNYQITFNGRSLTRPQLINYIDYISHTLPYIINEGKNLGIVKGKKNKRDLIYAIIKKDQATVFETKQGPKPMPKGYKPPIPKLPNNDVLFKYVFNMQQCTDALNGRRAQIMHNGVAHYYDIYSDYFVRQVLKKNNIHGNVRVSLLVDGPDQTANGYEVNGKNIVSSRIFALTNNRHYDYHYDVPNGRISGWFNENNKEYDWFSDVSGITIFERMTTTHNNVMQAQFDTVMQTQFDTDRKITFLITKENKIEGKYIAQQFADGEKHCLFNPIIEMCDMKIATNNSIRTQQKYKLLKDKAIDLSKQYQLGVPEDRLKSVCDRLNLNLNIVDLFGNSLHTVKSSNPYPITTMTYKNTRINHVQFTEMINSNKIIEYLTRSEIEAKFKQIKETEGLFLFAGTIGNINLIVTDTHKYKCDTLYNQCEAKFLKETKLDRCRFDIFSNEELTKFITSGTHICSAVDYIPQFFAHSKLLFASVFKQIDQEKAYTQFKETGEYYQGFLSKMNVFCKVPQKANIMEYRDFLHKYVGMYEVTDINYDNVKDENMLKHLQKMNIYIQKCPLYDDTEVYYDYDDDAEYSTIDTTIKGDTETTSIVLPSPELIYLIDLGVTFTLTIGCFCYKPIDFEFPEYMKQTENESDKLKFYAKFAGKSMKINKHTTLKAYCSKQLATLLANTYKDQIYYNEHFGELTLQRKKIKSYSLCHITAFLTSYMRINVLQQLQKMDADKILRVNMDGIYYEDHEFEIKKTFRDGFKDGVIKIPSNIASNAYFYTILPRDIPNVRTIEYSEGDRLELHSGAGGTGKTHNVLNRKQYPTILYTTICKRLVSSVRETYAVKGITLAKMVGDNWERHLEIDPDVIAFDEITMASNAQKNTLIERYPFSQIHLMGDIDTNNLIYQLPCVEGKPIDVSDITFVNDDYDYVYRCKCDKLRKLMKDIRSMILLVHNTPNNEKRDCEKELLEILKQIFMKNGMIISVDDVKNLYTINDYIITPVHGEDKNATYGANQWTNMFRGKFDKEKYMVTKNNQYNDNGTIIISDKRPVCSEIRHAFTIHSVQGQTCTDNIIIDLRKTFGGLQMIYTAISRAQYLNNIYIIY